MRQSLTFIELDIPVCTRTYGVAPCVASIPTTGAAKCFNTKKTCQDRANYAESEVTLRFAIDAAYLPKDIECLPYLASVDFSPATISLGENLGQRATLTATFADHPHSDTGAGFDPYLADRDYNPFKQGTIWGKFRARQPYLRGRSIRWITGYVGQDIAEMQTRHFIVESFDGPTPAGKYSLIAKDVLKALDGDRAQAPAMSEGFLVADIDASVTALTLSPAGIGATYDWAGYLNIGGSELVAFTLDPTAGNDANCILLLQTTGTNGSTSFTDSSSAARSVTANGNVQMSTARFAFGTSSALFDGTGDFLSLADNAAWTFSGDFTIEAQTYLASLAAARTLVCHSTDINNMWRLYVTAAGALKFEALSAGVAYITLTSANGLIVTGQFYLLEVERHGNVFTLFIDGEPVATATNASALANYTGTLKIGISGNGSSDAMNGNMQEVRLSNKARYSGLAHDVPRSRYRTSADTVTIVRGQLNTDATSHRAQDRVQLVLSFQSADPADIIADLMENYTDINPEWIDRASWLAETDAFLGRLYGTHICEPTAVSTLVSELVQQACLAIWWDDIARQIRFQVLRGVLTDAARFGDHNTIEKTRTVKEQPDKRISQVWTYFGRINPLKQLSDIDNYRSSSVMIDAEAEENYGAPIIKKIYSRWIPQLGRTVADRLGTIQLGRYRDAPRRVTFDLARYAQTEVELGGGYRIEGHSIQDEFGAAAEIAVQITRLNSPADRFKVEAEEVIFVASDEDLNQRNIVIDANNFNINLRAAHDAIYPPPEDDTIIVCHIRAGVKIGSTSTAARAFSVGDWPVGVTVRIIIDGELFGAGGIGGNGAYPFNFATNGEGGGTAFYTRFPVEITFSATGKIWGGGGGGGGGDKVNNSNYGAAGGGGAGLTPGLGYNGAQSGTETTGGAPALQNGGNGFGGVGGGPGLPGSNGQAIGASAGLGGPAGTAIDGISFVTFAVNLGDKRGPQIN